MPKIRLIPVLLLQNGLLVRSERFSIHQIIGNPILEVKRFNEWNVDELIYLDITKDTTYDLRRDDHKIKGLNTSMDILDEVSRTCFMPLTWGGGIRSIDDMHQHFRMGADKITINSEAFRNPSIITEGAERFGSQSIVVSIDVKRHVNHKTEVCINGGETPTGENPVDWAKEVENRGAGEILLQSIDRDGSGRGYDLELINNMTSKIKIPVIACSGIGQYEQYKEGVYAGASAVAAANIWHFKELSDLDGKRALKKAGVDVRL